MIKEETAFKAQLRAKTIQVDKETFHHCMKCDEMSSYDPCSTECIQKLNAFTIGKNMILNTLHSLCLN